MTVQKTGTAEEIPLIGRSSGSGQRHNEQVCHAKLSILQELIMSEVLTTD